MLMFRRLVTGTVSRAVTCESVTGRTGKAPICAPCSTAALPRTAARTRADEAGGDPRSTVL